MKLILTPEAAADMQRLHVFLVEKNPEAANRAVATIGDAIQTLQYLPGRGRPTGIAGMRELVVPFASSAYVIRYAHFADEEMVAILRIWHGREDY